MAHPHVAATDGGQTPPVLATVASRFTAVSNGALVGKTQDEKAGTTTWHWRLGTPHVAYLVTLPLQAIQTAPSDRVATATLDAIFPGRGGAMMAAAIMVSTFGCANGLILAGARAYYAMARDGVFFAKAATLNAAKVPAWALWLQGAWAAFLVLPRTFNPVTGRYGNLYGDLLDWVISAALIFYKAGGR